MSTFEIPPAGPQLRPERADADKGVLGEAVRAATATAPPRRAGAWLDAVGGAWRRRPALASASLATTVAVAVTLVVALTSSPAGPHPSPPSAATGTPHWVLTSDVSPSWHTLANAPYQPQFGLPGIGFTCPTTTTCYAVNFENPGPNGTSEVVVTTDAGQSWTQSTLPVTLSGPGPAALTCVDASTCALLGVDASGDPHFLETTDGGQTWTDQPGPTGLGASFGTRIVCSSATTCVGVTGGGGPVTATRSLVQANQFSPFAFTTTDGGSTWSTSSLPAGFLPNDLQCSSAQVCVTSGGGPFGNGSGDFAYTTDGGSTWSTSTAPVVGGDFGGLRRAACGGSETCLAVTGGPASKPLMLSSTDGGASWTTLSPTGLTTGFVMGLSCVGAGDCWATGVSTGSLMASAVSLGNAGFAAYTSDGGATWQASTLPSGVGAIAEVSCPTTTTCFALAIQQASNGNVASQPFVVLEYGPGSGSES